MFKSYLAVSIRNLLRHKGYSLINIAGLAVGLACCLLIYLWVSHELGYDSFHPHADRLYRITTTRVAGETVSYAGCSPSVIPVLLEKYPDVEAGVRCAGRRPAAVRYRDRTFREDGS